jgi:hypothetical protein
MARQLETRDAEESVQNCQNTILRNVSDRLSTRATTNAAGGVYLAGLKWTPEVIVGPMLQNRSLGHGSARRLQISGPGSVERGTVSTNPMM